MSKLLTITYKKTQFYKNAGSMKYVMKQIKDAPNKKLIHIHNTKNGRMWGAIEHDDILKWINKNIGLFEVITENYPAKVYFDIDTEEGQDVDLNKIKTIIKKYFGENTKMAISGYTNPKVSYHICLYEYGIYSNEDLQELKALVKYINQNENQFFDWKVYTNNRNMKAINQSKPKKSIQNIIEEDDPKNHLITFFIDTIKYKLPKFSIQHPKIETIKMENNTIKMDYSQLPKLILKLPDDIDLSNALEILQIIPLNGSDYSHSWTWRIALFCVNNGLTCNDFIQWYQNKSDDEDKIDKWKFIHWPNVIEASKKYPITKKSMLKTLQLFYPNILLNKDLRIFSNKFIIKNDIHYTDYLTLEDFKTDKKTIIINIQMGGGKTHNTIQYLKTKQNFCWITPNIALAENTHYRIKKENIQCVNYRNGNSLDERKDKISKAYNLMICLNSLKYVKQNYDILVIDEIETFLKLWFNNSTLNIWLDECWDKFITLVKNCKKLILLDAFLSKTTLDFLDSLNIDYTIIKKTTETNNRKIIKYQNFNQIVNKIINKIKSGNKCIIFYPYKNAQHRKKLPSMAEFVDVIVKKTNRKGIYHNADACDENNKLLDNVNKNWINYDFVVSNNKINVGLNFDIDYFDEVYLMVAGFNSPRDIVQFSYRARTLKSNLINYCLLDKQNPNIDVEIQNVEKYNDVYKSLFENVLIEKRSPIEDTMDFFFSKANYDVIGNCYEIISSDKLDFELIDYYDYDNLQILNNDNVKDIIKKTCCMESNVVEKLSLRRFFYDMKFHYDTPNEIKSDIWNNNKINFMDNCLNILYSNDVIQKLKDNYGWELYLPEEIQGNFKFNHDDLDNIFNNVNFKYLNKDKTSHNLILKSYLDTVYGVHLYERKGANNKNVYKVSNTLKEVYINVVENHNKDYYEKISGKGCLIEIDDYETCL